MYGYIYKRTNLLNGKSYVGQHKFDKNKIDESYRGSGTYFKKALKKYGESNFTYEIIDTADTPEELDEKEVFWIKETNSQVPIGYNICDGGSGIHFSPEIMQYIATGTNKPRRTGWHQSDYQKQVVRDYMKSREITDSFREKCSLCKKGNNNGHGNANMIWVTINGKSIKVHSLDEIDGDFVLGRTLSEDTINKMRENLSGRVYLHKDSSDVYVKEEEVDRYLSMGYTLGRCHDSYVGRGGKISSSKRGCVRIQNSDGKIKYVQPEKVNLFKELGYLPTNKKKTT